MIDRERQKRYILRSISWARSYIDETKRQGVNPAYNRGVDYRYFVKSELQYIIDTLNTYFK